MAEFAPVEFGAALGMSSAAATSLIEDALALRHRHPRIWARIIAGEIPAWRARKVAQATARLSRAAAALVDHRVANLVETVTPGRLARIVRAATMDADLELAQQDADSCAQERGVWVGQSNLHGTKTVVMKAAAGDVIRFDAATDHLADVLAQLGDTDTKDQRRAKAVGWLADPHAAVELWTAVRCTNPGGACDIEPDAHSHGRPRLRAVPDAMPGDPDPAPQGPAGPGSGGRHTLYVHLTDLTLATGTGVVRVEDHEDDLGVLLASQLTELLGHDKVVVKPVINLNKRLSVDAYEIPQRIREHVRLQHPVCQFPWCNRPASVRTDLDHTVPYDDTGPPGQTRTDNLVPLCRLHHRVKTHGRWVYRRLSDGSYLWTGPHGQLFRVDHTGTRRITDATEADLDVAGRDDAQGMPASSPFTEPLPWRRLGGAGRRCRVSGAPRPASSAWRGRRRHRPSATPPTGCAPRGASPGAP
ncbi:MAG: DUF222 domain-containing protein [Kribbellaceae bacterium]